MDIYLAEESAFHHIPQVTVEVAVDRLEQKKVQLVSGTLGALLSRAKPEDIQLVSMENRLEAYWQISVHLHTVYERNKTYTILIDGSEIDHVTMLGQDLPVTSESKEGSSLSIKGVEHCIEDARHEFTFDGAGTETDMSKYTSFPKTEVVDFTNFAPEGVLVIPPKALASTVVRSILSKVIKPVDAQVIHEERIDIEKLEINFRPVYAMEYLWAAKNKKVVLEYDALTGKYDSHGEKMGGEVKQILSADLIFDLGTVAAGALVPGGGTVVKLAKAVYDHTKK